MKFEDDWCGVFIRGDNAFGFAMYLEQVFAALEQKLEPSPIFLAGLKGFAALLRSCDERHLEEEPQHATLKQDERLRAAEVARLREVCAEAYQLAGAVGAPVKALDNLWAAANGEPIPHESFLPFVPEDCTARLRAAIVAAPHDVECGALYWGDDDKCNCWKRRALNREGECEST